MGIQLPQHRDELTVGSTLPTSAVLAELLPGHSRNSSGTSHSGSGSASGYGSLASQSQHSRQSSSGELGHFRSVLPFKYFLFYLFCFLPPCFRPFFLFVVSLRFCYLLNKKESWGKFFHIFVRLVFFVGFFSDSFLVPFVDPCCADVDFLRGLSVRRASPRFVYQSAVALAISLSPLLHRPSRWCQPKSWLVTYLPALAAVTVVDRKQ